MRFFDQLEQTAVRNGSLLCVGLDPRPEDFSPAVQAAEDPILAENQRLIDATRDLVCAYKPNYAFYEAQGLDGLRALQRTIAYIDGAVPVILDAKRGDIGATATAYAAAAFEIWGAGAVTISPYLGRDTVTPFSAYLDRGVFVLCHTSNPGAADLQALECDTQPLYRHVAQTSLTWGSGNVGLVVGATYPEAMHAVRTDAPKAWLLVPGVGAQGGDLEAAVAAGLRADGLGLIISVSRGISQAADPRAAAIEFREQINAARQVRLTTPGSSRAAASETEQLILDLVRIGAVRFGTFRLKSGRTSPIYIDLRLLASYPDVLSRAARLYAGLLRTLSFDVIAAIPYAALPIGTAVALQTNRPMIYPRKEVKDHGTRRAVEGVFAAGERAVVLDDLITTGESKIEALGPLLEAGLKVEDIVVLIDRESGGREELARQGYGLHAVLTLRQILGVLAEHGQIKEQQRAEVLAWLQESE